MPCLFRTVFQYFVLLCSLSGLGMISESILLAADPVIENASRLEEKSEKSTRSFTARDKSRSGTVRDWSRTIGRPVPVWASQTTDQTPEPKIRFASASGIQDGELNTSAESLENTDDPQVPPETVQSAATPSLSVKEQLLNALRAQREATLGIPETATKPGTLTILHSPRAKSEIEASPVVPSIAAPSEISTLTISIDRISDRIPAFARSRCRAG